MCKNALIDVIEPLLNVVVRITILSVAKDENDHIGEALERHHHHEWECTRGSNIVNNVIAKGYPEHFDERKDNIY